MGGLLGGKERNNQSTRFPSALEQPKTSAHPRVRLRRQLLDCLQCNPRLLEAREREPRSSSPPSEAYARSDEWVDAFGRLRMRAVYYALRRGAGLHHPTGIYFQTWHRRCAPHFAALSQTQALGHQENLR